MRNFLVGFCTLLFILAFTQKPMTHEIEENSLQLVINNHQILYNKGTNNLEFSILDNCYLRDEIDPALDFVSYYSEDFNNDNQIDLRVEFADASIENWYFFDKNQDRFSKIQGMEWIVNPEPLDSGSIYYFTRNPDGCTGKIFDSELFLVEKGLIIILGKLNFDNCLEGFEQEDSVSIHFFKKNSSQFNELSESKINSDNLLTGRITLQQYWALNLNKYLE